MADRFPVLATPYCPFCGGAGVVHLGDGALKHEGCGTYRVHRAPEPEADAEPHLLADGASILRDR